MGNVAINTNTNIIALPTMLTLADASKETGISYESLRRLCLQNKIIHIRVGRKYFINMNKLADFLNGEGGCNQDG